MNGDIARNIIKGNPSIESLFTVTPELDIFYKTYREDPEMFLEKADDELYFALFESMIKYYRELADQYAEMPIPRDIPAISLGDIKSLADRCYEAARLKSDDIDPSSATKVFLGRFDDALAMAQRYPELFSILYLHYNIEEEKFLTKAGCYEIQPSGSIWRHQKDVLTAAVSVAAERFDGIDVVEIGSWLGRGSTRAFIGAMKTLEKKRFRSLDPYPFLDTYYGATRDKLYEILESNIEIYGGRPFAELLRSSSEDYATKIPDESLELVFVDAAHDYESVRRDIEAFLPKVKHGGIIMGHDCEGDPKRFFRQQIEQTSRNIRPTKLWRYGYNQEVEEVANGWPGVILAVQEKFEENILVIDGIWIHVVGENAADIYGKIKEKFGEIVMVLPDRMPIDMMGNGPQTSDRLVEAGKKCLLNEQYEEAVSCFNYATSHNQNNLAAWKNLAVLLNRLNSKEAALFATKKCLELEKKTGEDKGRRQSIEA